MKRLMSISSSAVIVLVGCSSFNNSFNTYPPNFSPNRPIDEDRTRKTEVSVEVIPAPVASVKQVTDTGVKVIESTIKPCVEDPYPVFPKVPDLPIDALRKAGENVEEIAKIERIHIEELRSYISKMKKAQNEAKQRFMDKCSTQGRS